MFGLTTTPTVRTSIDHELTHLSLLLGPPLSFALSSAAFYCICSLGHLLLLLFPCFSPVHQPSPPALSPFLIHNWNLRCITQWACQMEGKSQICSGVFLGYLELIIKRATHSNPPSPATPPSPPHSSPSLPLSLSSKAKYVTLYPWHCLCCGRWHPKSARLAQSPLSTVHANEKYISR